MLLSWLKLKKDIRTKTIRWKTFINIWIKVKLFWKKSWDGVLTFIRIWAMSGPFSRFLVIFYPLSPRTLFCFLYARLERGRIMWLGMAGGRRPHRFPHDKFSSVYWIFTKLGHMIPLWKGKHPIYVGSLGQRSRSPLLWIKNLTTEVSAW